MTTPDLQANAILTRLLTRLQHNVLDADSESLPRIRSSQYERNKVAANIDYARTLLLAAEKQASTVRVQSERQKVQADLQKKREVVKRLNERLDELNQLGDEEQDDDDDSEDDDVNGEERREMSFAPARTDAVDGLDTGGSAGDGGGDEEIQQAAQQLQSSLRSRRLPQASDNHTAASSTARESLFANRTNTSGPAASASLPQKETLLTHNRTEQEALTTGLLSLARALKESSLQFSSSLETEKDVLKRAEGGLDKSAVGMETAERKMGMLRRMSEGQGWWGRIKLFGMIGGLWIFAFVLVFVGPKIRF